MRLLLKFQTLVWVCHHSVIRMKNLNLAQKNKKVKKILNLHRYRIPHTPTIQCQINFSAEISLKILVKNSQINKEKPQALFQTYFWPKITSKETLSL